MTTKQVIDLYGDATNDGYVYCDVCPLRAENCKLLQAEEQGQGRPNGLECYWEAIAEHLTANKPTPEREPDAPTQFEKDFAEAINRIDAGAYTANDVEMCRTALEFIGAARELADRLRAEREAKE